jgi:hypothetical protein
MGRDPWEELGVGERIILKWMLKEKNIKLWIGLT